MWVRFDALPSPNERASFTGHDEGPDARDKWLWWWREFRSRLHINNQDDAKADIAVGSNFEASVRVGDLAGLAGFDFDLNFDAEVLQVVRLAEGDLLSQGESETFWQPGTIDNALGTVTVTFSAAERGETTIDLSAVNTGAPLGEAIPVRVLSAHVTVSDPAPSDINNDGVVDIFDLAIVAQHFSEWKSDALAAPALPTVQHAELIARLHSEAHAANVSLPACADCATHAHEKVGALPFTVG